MGEGGREEDDENGDLCNVYARKIALCSSQFTTTSVKAQSSMLKQKTKKPTVELVAPITENELRSEPQRSVSRQDQKHIKDQLKES